MIFSLTSTNTTNDENIEMAQMEPKQNNMTTVQILNTDQGGTSCG